MSTKEKLTIYWCRRDFRLLDNPALYYAIEDSNKNNTKLLPIFILDPKLLEEDRWNIGYPRRRYLAQILADFALQFKKFEILVGNPVDVFHKLTQEYKVKVYVNSDIEPYSRKRDAEVSQFLDKNNGKIISFADQLSVDKDTVSGTGTRYGVFSPFRKKVWDEFIQAPVVPKVDTAKCEYLEGTKNPYYEGGGSGVAKIKFDSGLSVEDLANKIFTIIDTNWNLRVTDDFKINLDEVLGRPKITNIWYSNEKEALSRFRDFNDNKILNYKSHRDNLGADAVDQGQTSRISVALKWGLVSTRTLKEIVIGKHDPKKSNDVFHFISELIWREFYRYELFHLPHLLNTEYQAKYQNTIQWKRGSEAQDWFIKWIQGKTGYRVVDAAMHQIANEGWMHNRSRMIVASILTKNLGIDWRWGQEYFRSILLDLDEASNNGGWQWAASVGADPKPIRIFNPYTQAEKYDNKGLYQAKHLPADYNIQEPLIEHKKAREEALQRYKYAKENSVRDY